MYDANSNTYNYTNMFESLVPQLPYEQLSDARTQNWPLVESCAPMATLVGLYYLMVLHLPGRMLCRKPLQLQSLLIAYNLLMALLNAYICFELVLTSQRLGYNYWCQRCLVDYDTNEIRLASAVWWFYISKLLEFLDTFFFILRKKWEQLNFLHVYHHSTMFPLWWIAIKWVPTGSSFFPAMINSFVHVIMYCYYALSAFGPTMRQYLWWKKYLTVLQLVQFIVGLLWSIQALVTNCEFPAWINYVNMCYMCSYLVLFGRFYLQKY